MRCGIEPGTGLSPVAFMDLRSHERGFQNPPPMGGERIVRRALLAPLSGRRVADSRSREDCVLAGSLDLTRMPLRADRLQNVPTRALPWGEVSRSLGAAEI